MSLQASWNSALGIIGGLSRLKKISDEQKKTNETLNEHQLAHAKDVDFKRIESERAEENEMSIQEHAREVDSLNERILNPRSAYERIEDRRLGIGRASEVANRITNQMAAKRAQEHIQQADTPRNSGAYLMKFLRDDNETGGDN